MRILILAPYAPYPPHGGGTMRIYHILRLLAADHRVVCLCFVADEAAERALAPLRAICTVQTVRGPQRRAVSRRAWDTLSSPLPDMALRNASVAYRAALIELLRRETFDVVQAESIEMARYLADAPRGLLTVLDQFNAEYVLQRRTALTALAELCRPAAPQRALRHLAGGGYSLVQSLKLARYERCMLRTADRIIAVSEADRAALLALGGDPLRMVVAPNGVDAAFFSRAALARAGGATLTFVAPTLVFSGTLDYRPNVDALGWFCAHVLPLIRATHPQVRLLAVGKRPDAAVQHLAARGDLTLTGEVADVRPYLTGAAVYVLPMRIGGGIRLKLLEGLALEVPLVSTALGAEGIPEIEHGRQLLLADTPQTFAAAVNRLLEDRELAARLATAGRELAERYDWGTIVPKIVAAYSNRM